MPQKKKKYNARFPQIRIKRIMQTDEEVGKVATPVPIMISRALELFVESLLMKTMEITNARQARTLSPSHMRQCIMSESRFDFLRELVKDIPNISTADECAEGGPPGPIDYNSPGGVEGLAPSFNNGNMALMDPYATTNNNHRATTDRLIKRPYHRTMSHDPGSTALEHSRNSSHHQAEDYGERGMSSTSAEESTSDILKRKLLEATRKYISADGNSPRSFSGVGKLARLDSSPSSFSDATVARAAAASQAIEQRVSSPLGAVAKRRRKSNDTEKPPITVTVTNLSSLLPPTVSANISSPIIKIDYNQPAQVGSNSAVHETNASQITPIINIDFSNLISQSAAANGCKLVLNATTADLNNGGLSTPNLTTPTLLNHAPFAGLGSATASPIVRNNPTLPMSTGPSSSMLQVASKSVLEMDEDYDNI